MTCRYSEDQVGRLNRQEELNRKIKQVGKSNLHECRLVSQVYFCSLSFLNFCSHFKKCVPYVETASGFHSQRREPMSCISSISVVQFQFTTLSTGYASLESAILLGFMQIFLTIYTDFSGFHK